MYYLLMIGVGAYAAWLGGWMGWLFPIDRPPAVSPLLRRPTWTVGDRWTIETTNRTAVGPRVETRPAVPVRWQFDVAARELLAGHDCFRVEVRCVLPATGPRVTFWADARSLAMRQVRAEFASGGRPRILTESYQFAGDQPAPVLGPLMALPLDLPGWVAGRTKGPQRFTVETAAGPLGQKRSGDLRFAFDIEQHWQLASDRRNSAEGSSVREVTLTAPGRAAVRQQWQAGRPWPELAENGQTMARLISVEPAPRTREDKP